MEDLKTKCGMTRDPEDRFTFSSSAVDKYLTDTILGVNSGVTCEFTRWTGMSANENYVRMRVILDPKVVVKVDKPVYQGERILNEYASSTNVRADIIEALKPYMYPEINNQDITNLQRLLIQGLSQERLNEIARFRTLTYIQECNLFGIYLRPERIIADMISDPDSDTPRDWHIESVSGTTSDTISWKIVVDRGMKNVISGNVKFDHFFRT